MKKLIPLAIVLLASQNAQAQPSPEIMPGTLMQQGQGGRMMDATGTERIDERINSYLNVPELKSILTPGEFSEWIVKLKAGQIVISDARSEAFDPAIEITDEKGTTVLAKNDDRFVGDQRPLLLWECPADGTYAIRGRCFQNKSGGQFFLRYRIFNSLNVPEGATSEVQVPNPREMIFKVAMKKGQIKRIIAESPNGFAGVSTYMTLGPTGLPDSGLADRINEVYTNAVVAPVDGIYYVLGDVGADQPTKVKIGAQEITPIPIARNAASVSTPGTKFESLWSFEAKAGEFLQLSTPDLNTSAKMAITEVPDLSEYDLGKPDTNPFAPKTPEKAAAIGLRGAAFIDLPARDRDPRKRVIVIKRDCKIWVVSSGMPRKEAAYSLQLQPAARTYTEGKESISKLKIGDTDYWSFDAQVGEVMTFGSKADLFADNFRLYDPNLGILLEMEPQIDQASVSRNLIVTHPGRYLAAVSGRGNGGGGEYTLTRTVYHPKEFGLGNPASSSLNQGQVQVWKVTLPAGKPMLIKWTSDNWDYSRVIHTENGERSSFPLIGVDKNTALALMKVDKPTSYLIVLTGGANKSMFKIELLPVTGFDK